MRVSGCPYTIVRPGWFDCNDTDQRRLVPLQGDTRWASDPSDGVVLRQQIAKVLVHSLWTAAAEYTKVELVAKQGPPTQDFEMLFVLTQVASGWSCGRRRETARDCLCRPRRARASTY